MYAGHFIANHLKVIGGGQRGLLLNAYAFGKMGATMGLAAIGAFAGQDPGKVVSTS